MKFIVLMTIMVSALLTPVEITAGERMINIIYTGGINGELEPCGCSPRTDFGGLARLSGYLAAHKNELAPYVLVDAGNFTDKDSPQGRLKAEAVLKSYGIMKYDAVALMSSEMTFPSYFFIPALKGNAVPIVSDYFPDNRSLSVNRAGFKVNISTDPDEYDRDTLNILLTDRPVSEAAAIKGWDIIIISSGDILEVPMQEDGTVIVSGYPRGKKTGMLSLVKGSEGGIKVRNHKWLSLGSDADEDPRVRSVLNEYDAKVAALMKEREKTSSGDTYLGVSRCAECHQPYEDSWKKTRHAAAFDSLVKAGKSNDPECVACHAVGFGEKGGFFSLEMTPELANVQCEECHGLDREHPEDYSRPMKKVTEETCLKCHSRENSPDFDYPVYLKKITH
ncbi:MAG: multiheme c-type cytochrome [Nitrospirota bacterium]